MTHTSNLAIYRPNHEESHFHRTTDLNRHLQHQAWGRAIANETPDPTIDTNPTYATALIVPTCTCEIYSCEYPSRPGRHFSLYWAHRDYRQSWEDRHDEDDIPLHHLNGWSIIGERLHTWGTPDQANQAEWATLAGLILDVLPELEEPKLTSLQRARAGQWRHDEATYRADDMEKSWAALWANAYRAGATIPYNIDDQIDDYRRRLAKERRALAGMDPIVENT